MRKHLLSVLCILLISTQLYAQRTVTGKVTDENGSPLAGATVSVGSVQAITNSSGEFTIEARSNSKQLSISYVGYGTETRTIGKQTSFEVRLTAAGGKLDEVVVTGINRVKRSQYTGAATKLTAADISNRPVGSLDQLFQGKVPGILALTPSGQPGSASTIIIRGQGSIQGGTDPLYVVDGIPVEVGVFQSLNPNDFESIDILRDASASALYGSRASAGVIVITTKRGKSGKMQFTYNGQFGVKKIPKFTYDMMTTTELLKAQEDYGKITGANLSALAVPGWYYSPQNPANAGLTPDQTQRYATILDSIRGINTNWRDVFLRDGTYSNHEFSVSGGTGKTRIYSSLGLYKEQGTTLRTDMKRATWKTSVDYADDKFSLSFSSNVGYVKRNFQQSTVTNSTGNPFLVMNITAPYASLYTGDSLATGTGAKYAAANALDLTNRDYNANTQTKVLAGGTAAYKITDEITASVTAGVDFRETQGTNYGSKLAYSRKISGTPTTNAGFQTENLDRFIQPNIRPSIEFKKFIKEKNDISVAVYGEYIYQATKFFSATGYGIDPRTPNTPAAITQGNQVNQLYANVSGQKEVNTLYSGLLIGRYTYDNKYTASFSYRRDGSSKLAPDNRWAGFYSVGATWDAIKENFFRGHRNINTLRLKLSYGGSGNSDNFPSVGATTSRGAGIAYSSYAYQSIYSASQYSGLPTQIASYPGNPDLKWETTYVLNLGIDFGFYKNRVYGDINLYDKRTKDLFVTKALSATSGFASLNVNAGQLQNKGFEVSLNVEPIRTRSGFVWTINGNLALNRNKVLDLGGEPSYEQGTELIKVGMPLGSHYTPKWGGVDAATGAALYYDENGKLTTDFNLAPAVQGFGTWEAPWKGGFGTSVRYKGLEISTVFSFEKGANKSNNLEYFMENPDGFLRNGYNQANTLVFWQKPGDVVNIPKPGNTVNFTSKLIHNADFTRWRDLSISYTLPATIVDKTHFFSKVNIYIQAQNLAIWTKWRGLDPEAGAVNINTAEFPNPRAYTAGISVTF